MLYTIIYTAFFIFSVIATIYAHIRLPMQIHDPKQVWLLRGVLIVTGLLAGLAVIRIYFPILGWQSVGIFIGTFCAVHVPAALILLLKRLRHGQIGPR